MARSQLSAQLARRVDAEDVVQSAYRSFFCGARDGRYRYQRAGDLWQLLVSITLHKLGDQARHHNAAKRRLAAEQGVGNADSLFGMEDVAGREPSPLEAAALVDEVQEIMRRLPPQQQRVLELRLQGHNLYEIAQETHCCQRTVSRILERLKCELGQRKT
jgi:RNA polymerase sigma-70 factor (ECF subfamily)